MENATKALIIAGSILIAIILIAIGIKLATAPSNVSKKLEDTSSDLEASVFNSQFDQYFGSNKPGAQVKSLISQTIANNAQSSNHPVRIRLVRRDGTIIKCAHSDISTDSLQKVYEKISNSNTYKIRITHGCGTYSGGYSNGYIACITIQEEK